MKLLVILGLSLALACVQGAFLEQGKEFVYNVEVRVGAGSMDYDPHTSGGVFRFRMRLQSASPTQLNGEISDFKMAEYIGPVNPQNMNSDRLSFSQAMNVQARTFSIQLENGLFKSAQLDSSMPIFMRNIMKAWLGNFQMNAAKLSEGSTAFKSKEQTIHGECDISYTVTSDTIYKSMSLNKDCPNRPMRKVDDVGGHKCVKEEDPSNGLVSTSSTILQYERSGSGFKVNSVKINGAFVAQMYDTEGVSYMTVVNGTATLADVKSMGGSIAGGDLTANSLEYEFEDSDYKWNVDRDLKAKEPFFASGFFFDADANVKDALLGGLSKQKDLLHDSGNDGSTVKNAHKFGIDNLMPLMNAMDYDTLMGIYVELFKDKSEDGVMKANIFTELLGSTGTTAAAMVVRDLVKDRKFDNCRDTARVLISIPYHIRRPNRQLLEEFGQLESADLKCEYAERALPTMLGHLLKKTCMRAGDHKQNDKTQMKKCFKTLGKRWVKKFFDKFQSSDKRQDKISALSAMYNAGFGGQSALLQPIIDGSSGDSAEMRGIALWAAMPENSVRGKLMDVYFPVFAEARNSHEVRIQALEVLLTKTPTTKEMIPIVSVLRTEKDYEVINYVYAKLEAMAGSICPCDGKKASEVAGFFLKYLKQFSPYRPDYGFGVSKTYLRQFTKDKYGYAGAYSFSTIGSHDSTTPIMVSMRMSATFQNNYKVQEMIVQLRVEGLAKGLIRKFKSMDPQTWKTDTLEKILLSEMNIQERPSQPLKIGYIVLLKGSIAMTGSFEMDDSNPDKVKILMGKLQNLGSSAINHQRIFSAARYTLEQPTDIGLPATYGMSLQAMLSLQAKPKFKQSRGMFQVGLEYDAHIFAQGKNTMFVRFPMSKKLYGIAQDRIYHIHVPRTIDIGANPAKKELRIAISRPEQDHPAMFLMHSQTMVLAKNSNPADSPKIVVLSKGSDATRTRTVVNDDNSKWGFASKIQYFDCEMEVARGNTLSKALAAFMPYNKNPKDPWTSVVMGVRQITTFLVLYPRAEKCGIYASWSQSTENPVKRLELTIKGNKEDNGEKLFMRGRTLKVSGVFKAVGAVTRAYKAQLFSQVTPGGLDKKIKLELTRAEQPNLGIEPYKVCLTYAAKYPRFSKEMYDVDLSRTYQLTGKAKLEYGAVKNCKQAEGIISVNFKYQTTDESRDTLRRKWFYKDCMASKASPVWANRNSLPVTFSCLKTIKDAYTARRYVYDVTFDKMTDRMKNIITTAKSVIKAAALPTLGLDATDIDVTTVGGFLKLDATLKDDDRSADVTIETVSGVRKIKDYPLRVDWKKNLRNLIYENPAANLYKKGIIKVCQATSQTIDTMDNVTYTYSPPSCWTLMSGHCAKSPSYAVFIKRNGGNLPLAMKAFIGGYEVEIDPSSNTVKVDGAGVNVNDRTEYFHKRQAKEIFKITKWGSTYNIYSFLRVWIVFDGNFVNVVPAPSVKGQHCGLCGNYNRNRYDEMMGKDGRTVITSADQMVAEYKWKC